MAERTGVAQGRDEALPGALRVELEWDEEAHPRDERGRFGEGGGGDKESAPASTHLDTAGIVRVRGERDATTRLTAIRGQTANPFAVRDSSPKPLKDTNPEAIGKRVAAIRDGAIKALTEGSRNVTMTADEMHAWIQDKLSNGYVQRMDVDDGRRDYANAMSDFVFGRPTAEGVREVGPDPRGDPRYADIPSMVRENIEFGVPAAGGVLQGWEHGTIGRDLGNRLGALSQALYLEHDRLPTRAQYEAEHAMRQIGASIMAEARIRFEQSHPNDPNNRASYWGVKTPEERRARYEAMVKEVEKAGARFDRLALATIPGWKEMSDYDRRAYSVRTELSASDQQLHTYIDNSRDGTVEEWPSMRHATGRAYDDALHARDDFRMRRSELIEQSRIDAANASMQAFFLERHLRDVLDSTRVNAGLQPTGTATAEVSKLGLDADAAAAIVGIASHAYPGDWVTNANSMGNLDVRVGDMNGRAYHQGSTPGGATYYGAIAMPPSRDGEFDHSTAIHEYGHHMEGTTKGLMAAEWVFHSRRTGGHDANYDNVVSMRQYGSGYSASERTDPDHFANPYVGKEYASQADAGIASATSHYEVFTMGMEALFGHHDGVADSDHMNFILGVLAVL